MMSKINEAQAILMELGLPPEQYNEISALTFLSLANVKESDSWQSITSPEPRMRIHDILNFIRDKYDKDYAENTRETVRRRVIHQFEQAAIVVRNPDAPFLPTNSPKTHYALTPELASVVREYNMESWQEKLQGWQSENPSLLEKYNKQREINMIPVEVTSGEKLMLTPGKHNELQRDIIKEFSPRFAPGAVLLYLGDTANKNLYVSEEALNDLKIPNDKLPDVVLYLEEKNWVFLIEAVTSHGPVSPKRWVELEELLKDCPAERVYVSAFLSVAEFRKHLIDIAWETEVWLACNPDHLIHFNGDKFLGPYSQWKTKKEVK